MAPLTEVELSAIRGRHQRAARGEDDEAELTASIAHQDRARLLGAVEQLLPVLDAASLVARLVQRGALPPAARQALLELHIALAGVAAIESELEHEDRLAAAWEEKHLAVCERDRRFEEEVARDEDLLEPYREAERLSA